jgi:glycosyltransferase involved in cell wall biosynthesis
VLNALMELQDCGYEFDLQLIEKMKFSDAVDAYRKCDVLVDQLYAGWYGGVAVEAMALGKPVIAYIRDEDLKYIPKAMKEDLPIITTTPNDIKQTLERCLLMSRDEIYRLGVRSRRFVEKWHNNSEVAQRLRRDFLGLDAV